MKKVIIIISIIVVLLIASIVGVTVFVVKMVNKTKDPITATKFESIMEDKDFSVISSKNQFAEYNYIKDSLIAMQKDGDYQMEFYVLENEEQAKEFFKNNKEIFEEKASNSANSRVATTFKNGELLKLKSNGKYMVVSRIENTVVYVNANSEYKDSVDKILDSLGY